MVIVPKVDYYAFKDIICNAIRKSGKNMDCITNTIDASGRRKLYHTSTGKIDAFTNCVSVGSDSNLPHIELFINQFMYTLPPSFYARFNPQISPHCEFSFDYSAVSDNRWVMGVPFLNNFYQVYDMKRSQVGFVPSIYVNNQKEQTMKPITNTDNESRKIIIIISSVLLLLSLVMKAAPYKKR